MPIIRELSLNPCCSGRRSRTGSSEHLLWRQTVLILVVVEDGLVQLYAKMNATFLQSVLILIVVEDGLVPVFGWLEVGR